MAEIIRPNPDNKVNGRYISNGQEYAETNEINAAGESNVVIIPKMGGNGMISDITVALELSGDASAKIQVTHDSVEDIEGDAATFYDWDINGIGADPLVTASVMVEFSRAVTGFKVVIDTVTSGTAKASIRYNLQCS